MSTVRTIKENGRDITVVRLDDTSFIYNTNFQGDPGRDRFKGTGRYANVIIPDEETAEDLIKLGCNVKHSDAYYNDDGDLIHPENDYIRVNINMEPPMPIKPPTIRLIIDGKRPVMLSAETLGELDEYADSNMVTNVNCYCSIREGDAHTLYVKSLAVEVEKPYDPYEDIYQTPGEDEEMPF